MSRQAAALRFGAIIPLAQAAQAPSRQGIYRLIRQGQLIYVGEAQNLRRRLMQHLLCLTHLQISPADYRFRFAETPRQAQSARRQVERRIIDWHQQRRRLLQQRETEWELTTAAAELELEQASRAALCPPQVEQERFAVHRVVALPPRGERPRFVALRARLNPGTARSLARRLPGVFVAGSAQQARAFAARVAADVGGQVLGPERHGAGLPHFHVVHPAGARIHVWYGRERPGGEFMVPAS